MHRYSPTATKVSRVFLVWSHFETYLSDSLPTVPNGEIGSDSRWLASIRIRSTSNRKFINSTKRMLSIIDRQTSSLCSSRADALHDQRSRHSAVVSFTDMPDDSIFRNFFGGRIISLNGDPTRRMPFLRARNESAMNRSATLTEKPWRTRSLSSNTQRGLSTVLHAVSVA